MNDASMRAMWPPLPAVGPHGGPAPLECMCQVTLVHCAPHLQAAAGRLPEFTKGLSASPRRVKSFAPLPGISTSKKYSIQYCELVMKKIRGQGEGTGKSARGVRETGLEASLLSLRLSQMQMTTRL